MVKKILLPGINMFESNVNSPDTQNPQNLVILVKIEKNKDINHAWVKKLDKG